MRTTVELVRPTSYSKVVLPKSSVVHTQNSPRKTRDHAANERRPTCEKIVTNKRTMLETKMVWQENMNLTIRDVSGARYEQS